MLKDEVAVIYRAGGAIGDAVARLCARGGQAILTGRQELLARGSLSVTTSRQDQVQVAELVPEVAALVRCPVGASEELGPRRRLEQLEVRRLGLVPAREQAVDREQSALGRDDQARPAVGPRTRRRRPRRRSRARARPWCRPRSRGRPRRGRRSRAWRSRTGRWKRSGNGGSPCSERGDARVQGHGRDEDAARDELRHELRRERPAGARHLGAPGLAGRRRSGRPRAATARGRSGSGSAGRVVEGSPRAARSSSKRARQSRSLPTKRASSSAWAPPGRSSRAPSGGRRWRVCSPVRSSTSQVPSGVGVESRSWTRSSPRRASSAAGSVAEVLTTSRSPARQEPREFAEARVDELEVVPRRYEHRDVVATEPTRFRRLVGLLPNGARERAHAATPASSRAR